MWISQPGRKMGAKKPRPWMWSMWRWVSRMSIRRRSVSSSLPRRWMPVPASRTTQAAIVAADLDAGGVAAVPRGLRTGARHRAARPPHADDHALSFSQNMVTEPMTSPWPPVRGKAVMVICRATPSPPVISRSSFCGLPFAQGLDRRQVLGGDGVSLAIPRRESGRPRLEGHLVNVVGPDPERGLRRLVEEDEVALAVDDPHRNGQVLRQLTEKDHLDRLLWQVGHPERGYRRLSPSCALVSAPLGRRAPL